MSLMKTTDHQLLGAATAVNQFAGTTAEIQKSSVADEMQKRIE